MPYNRDHALSTVGHVDIEIDLWQAFEPEVDRLELAREHKRLSREYLLKQSPLPGVLDYLTQAKAKGLRVAIASNSSHAWVERHLTRLNLTPYFDYVRCREDVPIGKPAPDLYLAVLSHFSLTGSQAISFEDSNPGSVAAKRAGLWSVVVSNPSTHHHDFAHADLRLTSLDQVTLDSLLARFGKVDARVAIIFARSLSKDGRWKSVPAFFRDCP